MKRFSASPRLAFAIGALLALVATSGCDTGDGAVEGANRQCAYGGSLSDCPEAERTAEGACWRLVDCGAIAVDVEDPNRYDWGRCVDDIERLVEARQRAIIACIAASTCDELRVSNHCDQFGE